MGYFVGPLSLWVMLLAHCLYELFRWPIVCMDYFVGLLSVWIISLAYCLYGLFRWPIVCMGYFVCSFFVMQFSVSFSALQSERESCLLQEHNYIYAKTDVRTHLGQNMGRLYHS